MKIGPLRCTSLIICLAFLLTSSSGLEFSSSRSSSKPVRLLDSFFRPRGTREPATTPRQTQTQAGRAATRPAATPVELWKPSADMKFWEKIGSFYGAKDSTYAWPMALVHINIMLYAFTFWLTRPVLPYLSTELGASPVVFGQFQTFFSSVQLVGNPLIGRLCDTQGAKVALQMSQLATGLSYTLLGCAWNVPILFASQLPNVLMQSMLCAQAFVTDFSSEESRSAALGRLSISYGLGMICGPLVGGLLSEVIGYHGVAFVAGGLMFLPLLINSYSLPAQRPGMEQKSEEKSKGKGLQLTEVFKVLAIPLCRNLTIFMLLTGLAASVYNSTFSMAAPNFFKLSAKELGMVQTTTALTGVLANTFAVGLIEKKLSQRAVITLASLMMACTFGLYTMATSLEHLTILAFLAAWPSTALYTTVTSMLTRGAPREVSATVIGLAHAARSLCGIVAPTIGGYIYEAYGVPGIGWTCSALMILAAVWVQAMGAAVSAGHAKTKEM